MTQQRVQRTTFDTYSYLGDDVVARGKVGTAHGARVNRASSLQIHLSKSDAVKDVVSDTASDTVCDTVSDSEIDTVVRDTESGTVSDTVSDTASEYHRR